MALAFFTTGCLSNHYVIPKRDLVQLAQTNPQQRAQSVRLIQEFSTSAGPPDAVRVSSVSMSRVSG